MTDELEPARLRQQLIDAKLLVPASDADAVLLSERGTPLRLPPDAVVYRLDDDTRAKLAKRFGWAG